MNAREQWLERVRASEQQPHVHEWEVGSGTATAYQVHLNIYCWCGAGAVKWNGNIYNVTEPSAEVRTRQFEKRLWNSVHADVEQGEK